jgi:RNA polymerase sigma-70 factor (ECF subfamily)
MMTSAALEVAALSHQRRIFSFAYYLLSDREEAREITQEVLLRLVEHRPRIEPEHLGPWLLRVTRNACYDLLRRRRVRGRSEPLETDGPLELEAPQPGPHADAASAQFRRRLQEELAALDEPYRSVVILREVQGLAYQEIADTLMMPLNTVRVVLHRGRRRLRERLEKDYENAQIH